MDNIVGSSMSGVLFDALADVMARDLPAVFEAIAKREGTALAPDVKLTTAYLASGPIAALRYWWSHGHNDADIESVVAVVQKGARGF